MEYQRCNSCSHCSVTISQFIAMCSDNTKICNFLANHGVIKRAVLCAKCNNDCPANFKYLNFRCNRSRLIPKTKSRVFCHFKTALFNDTLFENTRISLQQAFKLILWWLVLPDTKMGILTLEADMSQKTLIDWIKAFRVVCQKWISEFRGMLGGNDNVVELIQINLYSKVRSLENWFICGYDRETGNCFVEYIDIRNKYSVLAALQSWVLPGSTLIVDVSGSWEGLEEEGYNLVDNNPTSPNPLRKSGMRNPTQMAKRVWQDLNNIIPKTGRKTDAIPEYVAEFLFKWKYPNHVQRVHAFFTAMADTQPGCKEELV